MILFNFFFERQNLNTFKYLSINTNEMKVFSGQEKKNIRRSFRLAYIVKKTDILSKSNRDIAKQKLIRSNIWQALLNKYYRQMIFLSLSSKKLDKYTMQLNYLNIHNIKRNQKASKYLLSQFSKSLFNGAIKSSLIDDFSIRYPSISHVQYSWGKFVTLSQIRLLNVFNKNNLRDQIIEVNKIISRKLNLNYLPLFTVSNHLGQMIIVEPPQELQSNYNSIHYKLRGMSNQHLYQGWFFTNHQDAQEYIQYISYAYGLNPSNLRVFACDFSTVYRLSHRFKKKIYFKILPNLQEIGKLLTKYKYYKNILFHKKQAYGRDFFQGQPIYMFQTSDELLYNMLLEGGKKQKYNLIFTDYETAINTGYKLSKELLQPYNFNNFKLVVYNLESFIKDQLTYDNGVAYPFVIVPSQKSYKFVKKYQPNSMIKMFYNTLLGKISYLKLWSQRIFWSLTSRRP